MEETTTKYPSFIFHPQWLVKLKSLNNPDDQYVLMNAIIDYGIDGEHSYNLQGAGLEYFNEVIKPDLDEQHRWHKRKLEISTQPIKTK